MVFASWARGAAVTHGFFFFREQVPRGLILRDWVQDEIVARSVGRQGQEFFGVSS